MERTILFVGIHRRNCEMIQQTLYQSLYVLGDIVFEETLSLLYSQQDFKQNHYQMVILQYQDSQALSASLQYIRKFDYRVQIIIITEHESDYFTVQKYNITFVLRLQTLREDIKTLHEMLCLQYQNKQFYLPNHDRMLSKHSIYYMESDKNYIQIHSMEGLFRERFTIKELCMKDTLRDFLLINKSDLLNPIHIEEVKQNKIKLDNGHIVYISRSKLHEVHEELKNIYQLLFI